MNAQFWLRQINETLRDPRGAARWLMSLDIARGPRWELLGLAMLLGVFATHFSISATMDLSVPPRDPIEYVMREMIITRPYIHAIMQMSILIIAVFSMYWVSRMFGGTGGFSPGILMVAWVEFIMSVFRVAQVLVWFVAPGIAAIIGLIAMVMALWLTTNFIAELHGFKSLFMVFVMILVTAFVCLFGFAFILALIGVTLPGVVA